MGAPEPSTVVIQGRFRGPPMSGNGGYVAGLLGQRVHGPARVRLHWPPPLDRALAITDHELRDGDAIVASAAPTTLSLEVPAAPWLDAARDAATRYAGFAEHPFPSCFVCGPERAAGDGLRIFPGATERGLVAAPFDPPADLFEHGALALPIVWAALDCPGYFSVVGDHPVPMLLGELAVEVRAPIHGGTHVVYGWALGSEGRKVRCGTALASAAGQVLAVGAATWIRPRE